MATTSVSSTLPALHSSTHLPSQTFQWSVSGVMNTAIVGFVCALFFAVLYRIVSSLPKIEEKSLIPYPQNELSTLCFICIDLADIPHLTTFRDVQVIIEDTQERRIATRYLPSVKKPSKLSAQELSAIKSPRALAAQFLPTLESPHEMIVPLPRGKDIRVRLEGAPWKDKHGIKKKPSFTFKPFQVDQTARYHLTAAEVLEEKIGSIEKHSWRPLALKASDYLGKTGVKIKLSAENKFQDIDARSMALVGQDQVYTIVKISLSPWEGSVKGIFLYYPMVNAEEKKFQFATLIRDWNETHQLYEGRQGASIQQRDFYIESIVCESYKPLEIA